MQPRAVTFLAGSGWASADKVGTFLPPGGGIFIRTSRSDGLPVRGIYRGLPSRALQHPPGLAEQLPAVGDGWDGGWRAKGVWVICFLDGGRCIDYFGLPGPTGRVSVDASPGVTRVPDCSQLVLR